MKRILKLIVLLILISPIYVLAATNFDEYGHAYFDLAVKDEGVNYFDDITIKIEKKGTKEVELSSGFKISERTTWKVQDQILIYEYFKDLTGIVMGRTDLLGSLNLSDSESDVLLNLVNNISEKIKKIDKKFIIGGNISVESDRFLNNILHLSNFETRKVMFDASILLSHKDFIAGINQALEFEIYWLESKILSQAEASAIDILRLSILKKRYQY